MNINFIEDKPFAIESPIELVEGASVIFSCTYWDDLDSAPTVKAYKNNQDVTSTVFPTNTPSASGNVATLDPATGLVGSTSGVVYTIAVTGVVAGDTFVNKFDILVSKDETPQ